MARIPGMFSRAHAIDPGTGSVLADNPAYAGKTPRPLVARCHDGSPFVTVTPGCGHPGHIHETQIAGAPPDAEIGLNCATCGTMSVWPPGWFAAAFQQMRDDGWIA